ncbi:armadillo-type protein [Mycena galericulata]|nr:armadillo-type protein [Mycena galericulata]
MDVPFVSSGALNRAHYTLVKNIESAPSPEIADSYILKEVESIRFRLRHPTISLKETRECLIILLYCFMSITSPALPSGSLDFALPHAVNLAEAGRKVHEKKIGYLFCAEIMTTSHELRLMLVNTLRKDLESPTTALVCLSLDNLIMSPSEDVIPAVQSRLQGLLSNQSPHIRRRALLACSALARYEPDLLRRITSKVIKRLRDHDSAVVCAALTVSLKLVKVHEPAKKDIHKAVNDLLPSHWSNSREQSARCVLLQILRILRSVGVLQANLGLILEIIRSSSESSDHPMMCAAFLLLCDVDTWELKNAQSSDSLSPAANIRPLLTSRSINDQYIFLECLSCVNPEIWAGTNAEIPAVLEEWEVGRVMEFLDSSDTLIRRKTLQILNRIDLNIVHSYFSQSLHTLPNDLNSSGISKYTTRLLEVVEIQTEGDGELYARQLGDLFAQMEARSPRYAQLVVESAVEMVLLHLRNAPTSFQIGCATALVTSLASPEVFFGQTMMVIVTALATEYSGRLSVPPPDILLGISSRLPLCPLSVQDACLLAMLRISAQCEQTPSEVLIRVKDLSNQSGRHIRQRCEEFLSLGAQKDVLEKIIQSAQSSSLPDFLEALHGYHIMSSSKSKTTPDVAAETSSPSPSRVSLSSSKLRYTAYEPPPPTARLRGRASSGGSSRSGSSQLSGTSAGALEELSKTVTAGDLTLAAAAQNLEMTSTHVSELLPAETSSAHAADLIAFNDSPFISDPVVGLPTDFESIWNGLDDSSGARGWCDVLLEDVIKRLESMEDTLLKVISVDELPFVGDLKIIINGDDATRGVGVLRVRASEEGGCLWRMRSGDAELRIRVKRLLMAVE